MKTEMIEVPELSEGWKAIAYRVPNIGEHVFLNNGVSEWGRGNKDICLLIVEKIQPRRIVKDEREHGIALMERAMNKASDDYFKARPQLNSDHNLRIFQSGFDRAWKVKETDIPLTNDEPKLSLSICECRGLFEGNQPAVNKVKKFIRENNY